MENKVPVHSGIACLNPKALTVLGGVVQSLYEEWQMNQKYSGFSRSSLRQLEDRDSGGPPPFVKLQVGSISGKKEKESCLYFLFASACAASLNGHGALVYSDFFPQSSNVYYFECIVEFVIICSYTNDCHLPLTFSY